jgi:hypothetical protein
MAQGTRTFADSYGRAGESGCRLGMVQVDAVPHSEYVDASPDEPRDDACHGVAHACTSTTTDWRNSTAATTGATMKFSKTNDRIFFFPSFSLVLFQLAPFLVLIPCNTFCELCDNRYGTAVYSESH